jgi:hypothetical protein
LHRLIRTEQLYDEFRRAEVFLVAGLLRSSCWPALFGRVPADWMHHIH